MTPSGIAPRTSLTVAEAITAVLAELRPMGLEEVPLETSLGRVLGKDVMSPVSLPPWDNASMDGAAEMVAHEFPHVVLVRNGENLGFARASNQAARLACRP